MTPIRNSRPRISAKPKQPELLNWILDKEKRATFRWISTVVGGFFIAGYYLSLGTGFTPTINLGQATLLLFQAFFVGTFLVSYFCLGIFSPAFAYRLVNIDIEGLPKEKRKIAHKILAIRNIVAQVFGASTFWALANYFSSDALKNSWTLYTSVAISLLCTYTLTFIDRLTRFDEGESKWSYWGSIVIAAILACVTLFFLWLVYNFAPSKIKASDWQVFTVWLIVAQYSAIFSVFGKSQNLIAASVITVLFFFLLNILNVGSVIFSATAYAIGIAERNPVTLIIPNTSCSAVRNMLRQPENLICEGKNAGVIANISLLNSLGERWVIKESDSSRFIFLDGKGIIVSKDTHSKNIN